jgi:hypothetical protein
LALSSRAHAGVLLAFEANRTPEQNMQDWVVLLSHASFVEDFEKRKRRDIVLVD